MSQTLTALRKHLRLKRKQLSTWKQKKTAQYCLAQLKRLPEFKSARKIGLYLDAFGEVQTQLLIEECYKLKKDVFLPMICSMNNQLVWIKVSRQQYRSKRFSYHRLGMYEPMASRGQHISHLDLLVMPLLACDSNGTRLGMGGGFYDRTLISAPYKPLRVGLAHAFQLVDQILIRRPWDQPLDRLVTADFIYRFKRKSNQLNNPD